MLRRLTWSSVPSPSFSAARLNEIIAPARRNNARNHISGMLVFTGANFLAILEGEELALRDLWLRLEQDQRHCDLLCIGDDLCGERWFPVWRMGYMVDAKVDALIESFRGPQARIDLGRTGAGAQIRYVSAAAVVERAEVGGNLPPDHVERRQYVVRTGPGSPVLEPVDIRHPVLACRHALRRGRVDHALVTSLTGRPKHQGEGRR
jgi:hypothetical protein